MPALFALLLLAADGPFALRDGQKVAFFGDSITQAGGYIADVEGYLLTRFPDQMFTLYNRGISSETISGTSEPDHAPRRPWAHERFARDITPIRPDLLVACFGMNDGNYFPFDEPTESPPVAPADDLDAALDASRLWRDRLTLDPNVSATSPVVRGTWVTVGHVVTLVVDGWSWSDILRDHPELSEADIRACLTYAVEEENMGPVS